MKLNIFGAAVVFSMALAASANAQWPAFYDGQTHAGAYGKAVTSDIFGNVIVTGGEQTDLGSTYTTIKYDPSGAVIWKQTLNNADSQFGGNAIATDSAGNILVTGKAFNPNGLLGIMSIKYDSAGNLIWKRRFGTTSAFSDHGTQAKFDSAGNAIVAGELAPNNGTLCYTTLKYSPSGELLWHQRYNGTGHTFDVVEGLAVDSLDNIIVVGCSVTKRDMDFGTVKYAPDGTLLWAASYDGPRHGSDTASSVAIDSQNNVIVCGRSTGVTGDIFSTVKYSTDGDQIWVKHYVPPTGSAAPEVVGIDFEDNVIVSGTWTDGDNHDHFVTTRYGSDGSRKWLKVFQMPSNPNGNDSQMTAAVLLPDGSTAVTGIVQDPVTAGHYTFATVKYSRNGTLLLTQVFANDPASNAFANGITSDAFGNLYVTGTIESSNPDVFITVKI